MAYVGPGGATSRVSSGETRVIDMQKAHPPSIIPSQSRLATVAIPNGQFRQGVGLYSSNYTADFIPASAARSLEGTTIQLLIPIKADDVVNEYTFVFTVMVDPLTQLVPAKP